MTEFDEDKVSNLCPICEEQVFSWYHVFYDHLPTVALNQGWAFSAATTAHTSVGGAPPPPREKLCWCGNVFTVTAQGLSDWIDHVQGHGGIRAHAIIESLGGSDAEDFLQG